MDLLKENNLNFEPMFTALGKLDGVLVYNETKSIAIHSKKSTKNVEQLILANKDLIQKHFIDLKGK